MAVICFLGIAGLMCPAARATTFRFDTDPLAGTPVRTAPGRQIVGGELFINFNIATDLFSFDAVALGLGNTVQFDNSTVGLIPSNVNVVVLETFDDDNNPLTPFGAGNAADLIASRVTTPGPGLFIYFNQSLNLPRLVYSDDLSSNTADLRILARMLNLFGPSGQNAMPDFTAADFEITTASAPEPATFAMIAGVGLIGACCFARRAKRN